MKDIKKIVLVISIFILSTQAICDGLDREVLIFNGTSEASAAVAVNNDMFVVADDENDILRIYGTGKAGQPVSSFDMTSFLDIEPDHQEADIEAATRVGWRIYWITSHGNNKDGKLRSNRYRFFATELDINDGSVTIRPVGKPYKTLVHELLITN